MKLETLAVAITLTMFSAVSISAQGMMEKPVPLAQAATGLDTKGMPAIEAHLLSTGLNGAEDSPVMNVRLTLKNNTATFYTYVSGWATFYDANTVRCGEGLFKVDALAPQESAETDTPGLRLRCSPTTWRIALNSLMTRAPEMARVVESATSPVPATAESSAPAERVVPINFIISIDGEEHPIQVNNPLVLKLGNRNRKIVLKSAQ